MIVFTDRTLHLNDDSHRQAGAIREIWKRPPSSADSDLGEKHWVFCPSASACSKNSYTAKELRDIADLIDKQSDT